MQRDCFCFLLLYIDMFLSDSNYTSIFAIIQQPGLKKETVFRLGCLFSVLL